MRPPIMIGHNIPPISKAFHWKVFSFFFFFKYSNQITVVSDPYITKCVHLSMKHTSLSGVSGTGIRHTIQIATTNRQNGHNC